MQGASIACMTTHIQTHHIGRGTPIITVVARVIDWLFGALYAFLVVRFVLEFFSARTGTGFFQFIRRVTDVFYAPFQGLFATTNIEGGHFVWPLLVAIIAYMMLHAGIRGLLFLAARD